MTVNNFREYEREDRAKCHAAYTTAPEFRSIEMEALKRGYRNATLSEIEASADSQYGAHELFCWRGGLWIKVGAS